MLDLERLAQQLEEYGTQVVEQSSEQGQLIWQQLQGLSSADFALVLDQTVEKYIPPILDKLDIERAAKVFDKLSNNLQAWLLTCLDEERLAHIFGRIPSDRLTAILEQIPDQHLGRYLQLTNQKRRQKIAAALRADDKTAGRMLNSDVLALHKELTVHKVIGMLQNLGSNYEILPSQYVVDAELRLIGQIQIKDLLKNTAITKLEHIMHSVEHRALFNDDQERVAELIQRADLLSLPVTDEHNHFLGVISANDVLTVIEEEMTEDSYKMSGLSVGENSYVNTGFWTIACKRFKWLAPLLLLQSISSIIISNSEGLFAEFGLTAFLTMLIGTGGNVGNQSATLVVRGLATGEINRKNKWQIFWREAMLAMAIGFMMVAVTVVRVALVSHHLPSILTISCSLFCIILVSVILGTLIPIMLDSWQIDPANSAAPFLATVMDILGVAIICLLANYILR